MVHLVAIRICVSQSPIALMTKLYCLYLHPHDIYISHRDNCKGQFNIIYHTLGPKSLFRDIDAWLKFNHGLQSNT